MTVAETRLVPAVERARAILDYVAETPEPPAQAEIGRALAVPKSSLHGLLATLTALGLLNEERGRYTIGAHVLKWAGVALDQSDMAQEFNRLIGAIPALAQHTITLSSLIGAEVVYTSCRNSTAPLGVTFRMGMRLPAVFTATGKAMLAYLPAEARATLTAEFPSPLTSASVRDRAGLDAEIARVRRDGFSIDNGQVRAGMTCIGAAVLNRAGLPVAGVALSMTTEEATPAAIAEAGEAIADLATRLSRFTALA